MRASKPAIAVLIVSVEEVVGWSWLMMLISRWWRVCRSLGLGLFIWDISTGFGWSSGDVDDDGAGYGGSVGSMVMVLSPSVVVVVGSVSKRVWRILVSWVVRGGMVVVIFRRAGLGRITR